MLTTCPECRTRFRLDHAQLEAKHGLVRCGYCRAVFNAYDTLLPEFESPPEPELAPEPAEQPASAWTEPEPEAEQIEIHAPPGYDDGPLTIPAPDADRDAGAAADDDADDFVLHLSERDERAADELPIDRLVPETADDPEAVLLSELPTRSQIEPSSRFGFAPLLLGFLFTLTLLAQGAYFLRGWLVEQAPAMRPAFEAACASLGCSVPLSADLAAIRVESSALETDPEQASRAALRVSFSNRSQSVQQWPHFVLKLTNWKGETLAQKVFPPSVYLAKDGIAPAGLAPRAEHEFRLDLDLGGLGAAGYEVLPKYP